MRTDDAAIRLADSDPGAQSAIRSKQTVNAGLRAMNKRCLMFGDSPYELTPKVQSAVWAQLT